MTAITKASAALVKPLEGAIVRRVQLGGTVTAPSPITLQADGKWDASDSSTAVLSVGIALQSGVDTDYVDAVMFGPVLALSGATIGTLVFAADAAGGFEDAVGTKDTIIGYAESATILFVRPEVIDLA